MSAYISRKGALPNGWTVRKSKKYPDRIYYFNTITGASTWECPELDPPRLSNNNSNAPSKRSSGGNKRSSDTAFTSEDRKSLDKKFCSDVTKKLNDLTPKVSENVSCIAKTSVSPRDFCKTLESPTAVVMPVIAKKRLNRCKSKRKTHVSIPDVSKSLSKVSGTTGRTFMTVSSSAKGKTCDPNITRIKRHTINKVDRINLEIESPTVSCSSKSGSKFQTIQPSSPDHIEDIEMLDVSVDLTKIDDLPANKSTSCFIVVDTNIFIEKLCHFDEIKDTPIDDCGPPHIFIPWVVIQELDSVRKMPKTKPNIIRKAQEGVKYVNRMLKAKHPRFHGQSPKEVKDWAQEYSKINDDRVLECCLSLANKMPIEKVILLTEDINLSNKALICDIMSYNMKSFLEFVKKRNFKSSNQNKMEKKKELKPPQDLPKEDSHKKEIDEIMLEARELLKNVLGSFLDVEMQEAYGDVWKAFKLDVTTLNGIFNAIAKYWKTVFSFHFTIKDRCKFELLQDIAKRPQGFLCEEKECLAVLITIEDLFCCIKKRWPDLKIPIESIQNMHSTCMQPSPNVNLDSSISNDVKCKPSDDEVVLSVFEHDWVVMNHLCGMVMDFYGVPHSFPYEKPDVFPSEPEFDRLMCNLYPIVQQLKQYMSRIVKRSPKSQPPGKKLYTKFCCALKNFVPSLQIEVQPLNTINFNAFILENYCNSPFNAEKLSFGYKQLETFSVKLEEALSAMISFKKTASSNKMVCD